MSKTTQVLIQAAIASVILIGCAKKDAADDGATTAAEQPTPNTASQSNDAGMSGEMPMGGAAVANEHSATGKVTAVDATAGTVTIAHGAVESLNWPAMTMAFKLADASQASTLHVDDRVKFKFTVSSNHDATLTMIAPESDGT